MYRWSDGSAARAAECARRHLLLYAQVSALARERYPSCIHWKWSPKHHLFLHCFETMTDSPMLSWTYNDEAAIGIAAALAGTVHPRTLPRTLMQEYRAGLALGQ